MDYFEVPGLATVYLEDSYVLDIVEEPGSFSFTMEFVLTKNHPRYHEPRAGEMYCYERGRLTFTDVSHVEWLERSQQTYTDAAGEQDLGNIDYLKQENDHWHAGGDWGQVRVYTTLPPRATLDT